MLQTLPYTNTERMKTVQLPIFIKYIIENLKMNSPAG